MGIEAECKDCRRLLDIASEAITRHVRATGRLDLARIRHEDHMIPPLEAAVREAKASREEAVAAYKEHRRGHARAAGTSVGGSDELNR